MFKIWVYCNVCIVKIFVIVVVVFVVCMLLNYVMWLWNDYGNGYSFKYFFDFFVFINILVYVNSCINFFIFGIL